MRWLLLAIVLLGGCSEPDPDPAPAVTGPSAADAPPGAAPADTMGRASAVTREVTAEGETERLALVLAAFPDSAVPFSTYVPEDAAAYRSADGQTVGVRWRDAELRVRAAPGEAPDAALARLAAQADTLGTEPVDRPWARGGFAATATTRGPSYHLTTAVGMHNGTTFVVETSVLDEVGDGFAPVEAVLLDEWRWADSAPLR